MSLNEPKDTEHGNYSIDEKYDISSKDPEYGKHSKNSGYSKHSKDSGYSNHSQETENGKQSKHSGTQDNDSKNNEKEYVNKGMEDEMEIRGYIRSFGRTLLTWILIILTAGFLRLLFAWYPSLHLKATHRRCPLQSASSVLLTDQYLQDHVSKVNTTVRSAFNFLSISSLDDHECGCRLQSQRFTTSTRSLVNTFFTEYTPLLEQKQEVLVRYFISKKVKYLWMEDMTAFEKLRGLEDSSTCLFFHQTNGINKTDQLSRRSVYGPNRIDIEITPILKLLFTQVLSPFYLFQFLASILWMLEWYYYYAGFLIFVSVTSIIIVTYQTRKIKLAILSTIIIIIYDQLQTSLHDTVDSVASVTVFRGNKVIEEIPSDELVPGDVISIPTTGCILSCDAVLVTGNCIVNESMLTGESVPVTKTQLPNPALLSSGDIPFSIQEHARHVLFCGTKVIQTRYYGKKHVRAVVIRTGYSTAKGELVRSILYPKPVDFKFSRDSYVFLIILGILALFGFSYTVVLMTLRGDILYDLILAALDLVTIAVPPALPAALTIGTMFAQRRLKKSLIFCTSPSRISISGTINVFCFDKTGTLTEEGLDLHSVLPAEKGNFTQEVRTISKMPTSPVTEALATCHSLTVVDNKIVGDPVDLIMFQATNWGLEEPGDEETRFDAMVPTIVRPFGIDIMSESFDSNFQPSGDEIGIIRQFPFSSGLQRMSVITRRLGANNFDIFTKGAPEMIVSLSKPETVPEDLHEVLSSFTRKGYRVLAIAWRNLPSKLKYPKAQRMQREQLERGLTFLGLVVLENRLKPQSIPVIDELNAANVRPVMITGDNLLTALSVARECGMVGADEKIILVKAARRSGVEYFYTDEEDNLTEIITFSDSEGTLLKDDMSGVKESADDTERRFHFAMDGHTWAVVRQHFPELVEKLVVRGTIFARMSPEQKAQLVESLQNVGYCVGMCGDGANDCGALKTAHAGLSLSDLEASIASPFTYKRQNIEGVPTLLREGRAALVTAIGIFKYMAMYSLTMFVTVCILYWINANMTDFEFLYIDLILLTSVSVTFSFTGPFSKLHKEPPQAKLVSVAPVMSLLVQTAIMIAFQTLVYLHVVEQPWFYPFEWNEDYDYTCYEANSLFVISTFQYVSTSIAFSRGKPYRDSISSNLPFLFSLTICIGVNIWLTIYPGEEAQEFFQLLPPPSYTYRLLYLGLAFVNSIISIAVERLIIESRFLTGYLQSKLDVYVTGAVNRYIDIENEMRQSKVWPPIPRRSATVTDMFGHFESRVKAIDLENSILSSLLDSCGSSYDSSLRSTFSLRVRSGSFSKEKQPDLLGSIGKELDSSSMGAIYPYLTEAEEFNLPVFGKVEGFSNNTAEFNNMQRFPNLDHNMSSACQGFHQESTDISPVVKEKEKSDCVANEENTNKVINNEEGAVSEASLSCLKSELSNFDRKRDVTKNEIQLHVKDSDHSGYKNTKKEHKEVCVPDAIISVVHVCDSNTDDGETDTVQQLTNSQLEDTESIHDKAINIESSGEFTPSESNHIQSDVSDVVPHDDSGNGDMCSRSSQLTHNGTEFKIKQAEFQEKSLLVSEEGCIRNHTIKNEDELTAPEQNVKIVIEERSETSDEETNTQIDNVRDRNVSNEENIDLYAQSIEENIHPHIPGNKEGIHPHVQGNEEGIHPHVQGNEENLGPFVQGNGENIHPHIQGNEENLGPFVQGNGENIHPHIQGNEENFGPFVQGNGENIHPHVQDCEKTIQPCVQGNEENLHPHIQVNGENIHPHVQSIEEIIRPHVQDSEEIIRPHVQGKEEGIHSHGQGNEENFNSHVRGREEIIRPHVQDSEEIIRPHVQDNGESV